MHIITKNTKQEKIKGGFSYDTYLERTPATTRGAVLAIWLPLSLWKSPICLICDFLNALFSFIYRNVCYACFYKKIPSDIAVLKELKILDRLCVLFTNF